MIHQNEVRTRCLSSIILIVLSCVAAWLGGMYFACFLSIIAMIMYYEWVSMAPVRNLALKLFFFAIILSLLVLDSLKRTDDLMLSIAVLILAAMASYFVSRRLFWSVFGVLYIALLILPLILLRLDSTYGLEAVIFIALIVWTTDIAAFFGGRAIQGPKLWKKISPNKTWSGALSGLSAAALVAFLLSSFMAWNIIYMVLFAIILSSIGQIGDLLESALKRYFKVKDTGKLIPGHGGFLDRMDALGFAAFAMFIIGAVLNSVENPAEYFFTL